MTAFTASEIEFLRANELPRQRWLADSNAVPLLHELRDRGLMQPAYGEFGPPRNKGEIIILFGRALPVEELISLYMLTAAGRKAYAETGASQ